MILCAATLALWNISGGIHKACIWLHRHNLMVHAWERGAFFPQGWLQACSRFRASLAIYAPRLLFSTGLSTAGVAQLVEHLICNQRVGGSNPSASSTRFCVA